MQTIHRFVLLTTLLLFIPWFVQADTGLDDREQNRLLFEEWRKDPEHYARLRRELKAFLGLSEERQQQLRRLDRSLRDEDSASYARLQAVLERYADWLESLSATDRQAVLSAPDADERLLRIRKLRERQWIDHLPLAHREALQKLESEPEKYLALLLTYKQEDRKRREEWRLALRNWDEAPRPMRPQPAELSQLAPQIQQFVRESLVSTLGPAEKARLEQAREALAKGNWQPFFVTVVALADRHPVRVPPAPKIGVTRFEDLPAEWQTRVKQEKNWPPLWLLGQEGKWPDYAFAVHRFVTKDRKRPPLAPMGPARLREFSTEVQKFIQGSLQPVLTPDEQQILKRAEGHWPFYPNQIMKLSKDHDLQVPGTRLPGSAALWEQFRARPKVAEDFSPEVPDRTLREFMQKDLKAEDRAKLATLSLDDPTTRDQVRQLYLKANPRLLNQLKMHDQRVKQKNKGNKN